MARVVDVWTRDAIGMAVTDALGLPSIPDGSWFTINGHPVARLTPAPHYNVSDVVIRCVGGGSWVFVAYGLPKYRVVINVDLMDPNLSWSVDYYTGTHPIYEKTDTDLVDEDVFDQADAVLNGILSVEVLVGIDRTGASE